MKGDMGMSKIPKDKITGIASILFGLSLLIYFIPYWVVTTDQLNHTNPDTFPKFIAVALIVLGAVLLIQAFMTQHRERKDNSAQGDVSAKSSSSFSWKTFVRSDTYCILATALTILLFDILLGRVGYLWTGCICSVFLLAAFRSKKWYHYVIVIAFTFLLYYIFAEILLVKMP